MCELGWLIEGKVLKSISICFLLIFIQISLVYRPAKYLKSSYVTALNGWLLEWSKGILQEHTIIPVVKQSLRKGEMKSTAVGENVVWARAETWQSHGHIFRKGLPAGLPTPTPPPLWVLVCVDDVQVATWESEPDQKLMQKGFPRGLRVSKFTGLHV